MYHWPDGRVLQGAFLNGRPNGFGVLKNSSGQVEYEGEWLNGQQVRKAE